jgi:RNA polymerase sigma-70 factor (ECF subfamily)
LNYFELKIAPARESETLNDEQLMAKVMTGDEFALALLVERHHSALLGYLYRLNNGDRALAEDLVQEAFLRILRPANFQPGRPFKPWLYAIATNLARDHFKSATARYSVTSSSEDERLSNMLDSEPGPEELVLMAEKGNEVANAINRVGPEYKAALLLRFYNDLSLQEIAQTLNIPIGTVKSRLSVGTRRLLELLKPKVGSELK